jgi:phosphoglycolate phosphatase
MTLTLPRRLVLFDMDGTLVSVSHVHWDAYRDTILSVYGVDAADFHVPGSQSGNTQKNLIRAVCLEAGLADNDVDAHLDDAMGALADNLIRRLPADVRPHVLPGVLDVLNALTAEGHALALVTGTLVRSARTIMQRADLARYFPACACGEEGQERIDLVRLAISRASAVYNWLPRPEETTAVGDAPRDIEAGRAAGVRTVAVATGYFQVEELAAYEPDAVLPDLSDWRLARDLIIGSESQAHRASG